MAEEPLSPRELDWFLQNFPALKPKLSEGHRIDRFKEVLNALEDVLGAQILPISLATLPEYRKKFGITSFEIFLPLGETIFQKQKFQQQGVVIYSKALSEISLKNYNSYYETLCSVSFNSVFEPKTKVQLKIKQLLQRALANNSNYSFNRTLVDSSGTSGLSEFVSLGCISFEQLMTYFSSLKRTQFHRQLGWILYCKLKHQHVEQWPLPSLTPQNIQDLTAFVNGHLSSNFVNEWVNIQSRNLLDGRILSNRSRLILSAYLIRDLGLSWRSGQVLWRVLLKDSHPLINAYNWRAQSRNRFLRAYNIPRQILLHDKEPKFE